MRTIPAFARMMNVSVAVTRATVVRDEWLAPQLDDYAAISGSPFNARIEGAGGIARSDPFFDDYPEASHRMFWAVGVVLKPGDIVTWTDPESSTARARVSGPPQNEGGAAHHYSVGLEQIQLLPSGVS